MNLAKQWYKTCNTSPNRSGRRDVLMEPTMGLKFIRSIRIHFRQYTAARRISLSVITGTALICTLLLLAEPAVGQDAAKGEAFDRSVPRDVLTEADWAAVERSVDRGLEHLIRTQRPDGSFNGLARDEPGITGLCMLAFLSRGHRPGEGTYGAKLSRTVNYLLKSQQQDGLIARERQVYHAAYSHGIGALVIAELYGLTPLKDEAQHRQVIERAIKFTDHRYSQPKASADDEGGWRYLRRHAVSDSDLSITSWNLMFLRSAKNSGFDVNLQVIEEAVAYMQRVYDPQRGTFRYEIHSDEPAFVYSRAMAGAGVLSMSMAGKHGTDMAQTAAKFILRRPFDQYERPIEGEQYPCYSAFYCSQAMYHMGGKYWREYYPTLSKTIVAAQQDDGCWNVQSGHEGQYGPTYMTALTVLALTPPYQMLPVFQR